MRFSRNNIFVSDAGDLKNSIKPIALIFGYAILHNNSSVRNENYLIIIIISFFFTDFQRKKLRFFFTSPPFCYLLIKMFNSSLGRSHEHTEQ